MIGVGIGYMLMGSVRFLNKKLNLTIVNASNKMYACLFYSGLCIVVLTMLSAHLQKPISYVLPTLPVFVTALYSLTLAKKEISNTKEGEKNGTDEFI